MIIYKITNDINGKVYVGQTTGTLHNRWREHLSKARNDCHFALHNAIRKYGAEHFHPEIIDIACSREELDAKEEYWISTLNSKVPIGYNIRSGGKTSTFSEETLKKKHDALYRKPSGRSKPIKCVETGEVLPFAKEFYYKYGYQHSKIIQCCKGRRYTHAGLHWEYA